MTEMVRFVDNYRMCWSRVDLHDRNPIWISVARSGIVVKRSRIGMFGEKLFNQNAEKSSWMCRSISKQVTDDITPIDMCNPSLTVFTNGILHCQALDEVRQLLRVNRIGSPSSD